MSTLGDLFTGLRQVLVLEHRVEELAKEVSGLRTREESTRERLVRLETIIDEARRRGEAKRLPGS